MAGAPVRIGADRLQPRTQAGIALINSVGNLGGYFGPDMIGRIRMAMGGATEPAFYTLAGVALLGALIILFLPRAELKAAPLKTA